MKKQKGKVKYFKAFLIICFALLIATQIFYSLKVSSYGADLLLAEQKVDNLKKESQLLEMEISKSMSLKTAKDTVGEIGFLKPTEIIYLNDSQPIAKVND